MHTHKDVYFSCVVSVFQIYLLYSEDCELSEARVCVRERESERES